MEQGGQGGWQPGSSFWWGHASVRVEVSVHCLDCWRHWAQPGHAAMDDCGTVWDRWDAAEGAVNSFLLVYLVKGGLPSGRQRGTLRLRTGRPWYSQRVACQKLIARLQCLGSHDQVLWLTPIACFNLRCLLQTTDCVRLDL